MLDGLGLSSLDDLFTQIPLAVRLDRPLNIPGVGKLSGLKVTTFLEVEGAAHYLPAYAGNLDIMTSAALRTAERIAELTHEGVTA